MTLETGEANTMKNCARCNKETERLYGLFVPIYCRECINAIEAGQRATGQVCGMCRQADCYCCC